jgi:hypothetical protein
MAPADIHPRDDPGVFGLRDSRDGDRAKKVA